MAAMQQVEAAVREHEAPSLAAVDLDPAAQAVRMLDVLVPRQNLLRELGRLREAESYFRASFDNASRVFGQAHPNTLSAMGSLGEVVALQGRHAEALGPIHTAMRLNPHYPAPYPFNLGWAYQETGQVEEARARSSGAVCEITLAGARQVSLLDLGRLMDRRQGQKEVR